MILNNQKKRDYYIIAILILLAIIGIILISFISSKWGIGLSPDSVFYIAAAKNILNGNGVTVLYNDNGTIPLNLWIPSDSEAEILVLRWPPLYPAVLSLSGILGLNLIIGARIVSILLFGANIFLIGIIIYKFTRSIWLAIFSSVIMITSDVLLAIHSYAHSESLFIFFGFLGLFLLISSLKNNKMSYLCASAFMVAFAFLTRYIGVTLVAAGILGIIFLSNESINKRIKKAIIFILISCFPMVVWLVRILMISGNLSDRVASFHPVTLNDLKNTITTMSGWLVTKQFSWVFGSVLIIIFISIIVIGLIFIRNRSFRNLKSNNIFWLFKIILLFSIFIIFYLLFLILSKSFIDAQIPISSNRILSPVFIAALIITILFIKVFIIFTKDNKVFRLVVFFICLLFAGSYIYHGINWSIYTHNNGQGYAQESFISSEVIKEVKALSDSTVIYSNAPELIYLFTGKPSNWLPAEKNINNLKVNSDYFLQIENMITEVKEEKGKIIFFNSIARDYLVKKDDLKKEFSLCLFAKRVNGEIYEACSENLELVTIIDYSNFNNYWLPLSQCEFIVEDNSILVKVNENDPWFESKFPIKFEDKKPLMFKFSIESPVDSELRIFYGRKNGEPYILEDSYGYPLIEGENTVYIKIPYSYDLEKIRIDPIDCNCDCIIKKIEIYNVED